MSVAFCAHNLLFYQNFRQFRSGLLTVVFLHPVPGYQQNATRGEFRFQHSETLPHQSSCPVADNGQQAVFFAAYYPALQTSFGGWGNHHNHARSHAFHTVTPNLFKLRFKTQFILFVQAQALRLAVFRAGLCGRHVTPESGSQAGAAFLTAASDHIAAAGGGHTGKETDPAFTTAV